MEASLRYREGREVEPVFIFLFFFNTLLLPQGISFTMLLTPVWLYLLHITGRMHLLRYLLIPAAVYAVIHVWLGADLFYYTVSATMLLCIGIFCLAAWHFLNSRAIDYGGLFHRIVWINFWFTVLSLILLFVPFLKPLVWYIMAMSDGMAVIPRLKLFTYEASHYSYLLAPVAIYFYAGLIFGAPRKALPGAFLITVPLALSLSFGVIGALLITGLAMTAICFRAVFDSPRKRKMLLLVLLLLAFAAFLLFFFFPDNILAVRLQKILNGQDTSARGRTYESFILANKIVAQKSFWWGIGPGQLKIFGRDIIIQYYYYSRIPETIRIPNACAETIVCFGYAGFVIRIGIQLLLFYTTRVYRSPYRMWLFLFLFLFQFTGSFITNVTEYIFWMLAFSPALDFFVRRQAVRQP